MSRTRRQLHLGISVVVVFLLASSAGAAERRQPLLQLQGSEFLCTRIRPAAFQSPPWTCVEGIFLERTILILRNARAIATTTEAVWLASEPAVSTIRDGFLTDAKVRQLDGFLSEISIANRTGRCNPFGTRLGSSGRYTIFWYGPKGQHTTVLVGTEFPRECPAEILDLFNLTVGLGESIRTG